MLTQSRLKELLHYNPDTGVFTWKVDRGNAGSKKGDNAGWRNDRGYLHITISGKAYKSHRLAFLYCEGEFPKHGVDHINGIKDDNRWDNIRHCTQVLNSLSASIPKSNKSGVKGVCWDCRAKRWRAKLGQKSLGSFKTKEEAIQARREAEAAYPAYLRTE